MARLPTQSLGRGLGWTPFDERPGFTDPWWHHEVRSPDGTEVWVSFLLGGQEVARAELEMQSDAGISYGVRPPTGGYTEIVFLEIREDLRRTGIGRAAVGLIAADHPGSRLAAFSEDADEFWSSLGWAAHVKPKGGSAYRVLFTSD
jgi:hypothetical protein